MSRIFRLNELDSSSTRLVNILLLFKKQMMRAMQPENITSPLASFRRNIQNHSTPLNGTRSSNRLMTSNRKKGKKRKLVDSSPEIIDLTPKKPKVSSSDSDVEIIEPEPPTIIDLVEDETYSCNALTAVNAAADIATTVESIESETTHSDNAVNNNVSALSVIADSLESTECVETETSMEAPKVIETNYSNITDQPTIESVPLYVKDSSGGSSIKPPLYDLVSDDSFCFDTPFSTPISSQDFSRNKTLVADDSVIFVSETNRTPQRPQRPLRLPRADDFISINDRGGNRLVSISFEFELISIWTRKVCKRRR